MKILIAQPQQEKGIYQLNKELKNNPDIDVVLFPEGYIKSEDLLEDVSFLSTENNTMIITGYKDFENKDRALIFDRKGKKILDRAKTPIANKHLIEPVVVSTNKSNIGYILCMEILKGLDGFTWSNSAIKFIAHPIGTGMFSDDQFNEWIDYAKKVALKHKCYILGTSHADGSYNNCGISIPISYCIDNNGQPIFISKSDTRTRVIDIESNEFFAS